MSASDHPGATGSVAIIGTGGYGRVVAGCLRAAGIPVAGFWDDDPHKEGTLVAGVIVQGFPRELSGSGLPAIIGVGDNRFRQRLARLDLDWVTVVHPAAFVDPDAVVGPGTVVCAGAVVQSGAVVGSHAIVNSLSSVDHDARVEDFAHISAAHLGAGSSVGEGAILGLGSVVLPNHHVGAWTTVAAGAVVRHDVPDGVTVVGSPARVHVVGHDPEADLRYAQIEF